MYEILVLSLFAISIGLLTYIFYLKRERSDLLQEINDELLGSSNGTANQSFCFNKYPLISVSVWVKETFVSDNEIARLKEEKAVEFTDKKVWINWQHVEDFSESDEDSRHFTIEIDEDGNTIVKFGDGVHGAIPPAGIDNIKASYRTRFGTVGNVPAGKVKPLKEARTQRTCSRLVGLAQQIIPKAKFEDLVLPDREKQLLREIVVNVAKQKKVCEKWGFEAVGDRGLGISALFLGPNGTGKTMAAEVLANELRVSLFKIDPSTIVSKYIGETEKNLQRVFDAAECSDAILFFDEADALFGKRSEVRDSHDRYANIEINYLLQRMESYKGLAIMATNKKNAIDPAFVRRIRFVVNFPFPDEKSRAEIWRRVFPSNTPTKDLDVDHLARLNITGGEIRNIALNASFQAADEGVPVNMNHLKRAVQNEYTKLGRPLRQAELKDW